MHKDRTTHLTNDQRQEIERLARTFRRAIEQCEPRYLPIGLQHFPNGACGDAALLLAEYLDQHGHGRADYVLGYRGEYSHAWLELGGTIVDITADQFEDYTQTTFVVENMLWHSQFLEMDRFPANWRRFDQRAAHTSATAYAQVIKRC